MRERTHLKKRLVLPQHNGDEELDYRWSYTPIRSNMWMATSARRSGVPSECIPPAWANIKARTRDWSQGQPDPLLMSVALLCGSTMSQRSIAHDRRLARWVHKDEEATLMRRRRGIPMVADLVSADMDGYGRLMERMKQRFCSGGKKSRRILYI